MGFQLLRRTDLGEQSTSSSWLSTKRASHVQWMHSRSDHTLSCTCLFLGRNKNAFFSIFGNFKSHLPMVIIKRQKVNRDTSPETQAHTKNTKNTTNEHILRKCMQQIDLIKQTSQFLTYAPYGRTKTVAFGSILVDFFSFFFSFRVSVIDSVFFCSQWGNET